MPYTLKNEHDRELLYLHSKCTQGTSHLRSALDIFKKPQVKKPWASNPHRAVLVM